MIPWVRVDVNFRNHPKGIKAGPLGRDLFVCGLQYCGEYLTNGFISEGVVPHLAPGQPRPKLVVKGLVDAGLWTWDAERHGYVVHDYLERNQSKDQVDAGKEQRREAGRLGGLRSSELRRGRRKGPAGGKRPATDLLQGIEASASEPLKQTASTSQPHPHVDTPPPSEQKLEHRDDTTVPSGQPPAPADDPHQIRAVLRSHAEHFQKLRNKPFVIRWKADAGKIKPVLDVHGLAGTLRLQEQFFASTDGWWVHKHDYTIGTFVSAVNILAGNNGHAPASPRSRDVNAAWEGRAGGKVKL